MFVISTGPIIYHTKRTYHLSYQMEPIFCYTIKNQQFAIPKGSIIYHTKWDKYSAIP